MKFRLLSALVLAGLMLLGGGELEGVAGQEESFTRSLTVQQAAVYSARPTATAMQGDDALKVVAWVDRADYTYALDEPVRIFVQTNKDAYVTVLNTDAAGKTTQLLPNQYQPENFVAANRAMEVPDPDSPSRIVVTGVVGDELLKVVASTRPVSLFEAGQLMDSSSGPFQVVRTQARGTARSLSVVMSNPRPAAGNVSPPPAGSVTPVSTGGDGEWAVCHQKIKTVARATLASSQITRSLRVRRNDSGGSVRCEE